MFQWQTLERTGMADGLQTSDQVHCLGLAGVGGQFGPGRQQVEKLHICEQDNRVFSRQQPRLAILGQQRVLAGGRQVERYIPGLQVNLSGYDADAQTGVVRDETFTGEQRDQAHAIAQLLAGRVAQLGVRLDAEIAQVIEDF